MSVSFFIAVVAVVWLVSCLSGAAGLVLGLSPGPRRFPAALVCSCVGLATATIGLARIKFQASQTVNGRVQYSVNSKWFFLFALALALLAIGVTLWKRRQSRPPKI